MPLIHNNTLADSEPSWGSVDKSPLPSSAYSVVGDKTKKTTWHAPHHWVKNGGDPDEDGVYTTGDMFLHRGGVIAAWAATAGARTGEIPPWAPAARRHLIPHRDAIGLDKKEMAWTPETATKILNDTSFNFVEVIRFHLASQPEVYNPATFTNEQILTEWELVNAKWSEKFAKDPTCKCLVVLSKASAQLMEEAWSRGIDDRLRFTKLTRSYALGS